MLVNIRKHICFPFSFSRATLYVGKYSTSLYASPSLVHDGVTVVVSHMYITQSLSGRHEHRTCRFTVKIGASFVSSQTFTTVNILFFHSLHFWLVVSRFASNVAWIHSVPVVS